MKLVRLFGFRFSGSSVQCDQCPRLKRHRFPSRSISLRFDGVQCHCVYRRQYLFGFPVIETRKIFPDPERAEDYYLGLYEERFKIFPGR